MAAVSSPAQIPTCPKCGRALKQRVGGLRYDCAASEIEPGRRGNHPSHGEQEPRWVGNGPKPAGHVEYEKPGDPEPDVEQDPED